MSCKPSNGMNGRKVSCCSPAAMLLTFPDVICDTLLDAVPRRLQVGPKEDPHKMGLVLEWVYGTIVSTAEKARDGAKRALGEQLS
jgi:hypothetical protein